MNNRFTERDTENPSRHGRPLLGISGCLLGQAVRFDGGHKRHHYIMNELSKYMDFESTCPELEAGFGLPRPAMQLRKHGDEIRLVYSKQVDSDITSIMREYARQKMQSLSHLDGFIFKKDSPSCGAFRVPVVVHRDGMRERMGVGVFAEQFQQCFPLIPVEEEGRLNDATLCENFFERVYAYKRWKAVEKQPGDVQVFIEFHASHKFMLMARGSEYYQELGRLVSGVTRKDLAVRRQQYAERFMQVMKIRVQPGRQVNVLQHIMGYVKNALSRDDKQELLSVFDAYRKGKMPLITAVTLLKHHLRIHPQHYIASQHYLDPYPEDLALRSVI